MPYNSVISRTGAEALMPEDVSREILQNAPKQSAIMQLARRLPNMTRKVRSLPVLTSLPMAHFVNGDTGMKQTSTVSWDKVNITAEELAVIVPIPEAVLDDSEYDIWGEVRPRIEEAFGLAFDKAVLFGDNAPADWPTDILAGATAASQTVDLSATIAASDDIYDAILGESGVISLVEADGFMANGHVGALTMKAKLRGLRDTTGQPIFLRSMQDAGQYELDGEPIYFPENGAINPAEALLFTGDWNQLVWAVRQDVTVKVLDQAVIQDGAGNIIYNLAQQDMVALRCVFRLGWALPNPINPINSNSATRYPFAVLVP